MNILISFNIKYLDWPTNFFFISFFFFGKLHSSFFCYNLIHHCLTSRKLALQILLARSVKKKTEGRPDSRMKKPQNLMDELQKMFISKLKTI